MIDEPPHRRPGYHRGVRAPWLAIAVAAACYAPSFEPGLPCSPTEQCPGEQVCELATHTCQPPGGAVDAPVADAPTAVDGPDAAIDAPGPPGDRDNDGVADADDNCPAVGNPDQRDHDDDRVGDACDVCPGIADPAQADTTESVPDGVGDACDPWPTTREHLAWFDGFDASPLPAHWVASGTYTFLTDGTVRLAPGSELCGTDAFPAATRIALEFGAVVDGFDPAHEFDDIGAYLERSSDAFTNYGCYFESHTTDGGHYLEHAKYVDASWTGLGNVDSTGVPGPLRVVHAHRRASDPTSPGALRCQLDLLATGERLVNTASGLDPAVPDGAPSIYSPGTTTRIDYAAVYVSTD